MIGNNNRQAFSSPQAKMEGEDAPVGLSRDPGMINSTETRTISQQESGGWLALARHSYEGSTTYLQAHITHQWLHDQALNDGRHPPGSKYYKEAYKARSKLFRPKTRTMTRQKLAAAARALFSTADVVNLQAKNDNNPEQAAAAKVMHELINIRLNEPGQMHWFLNCMGAVYDATVNGVCIGHQYWKFQEVNSDYIQYLDDGEGGVKESKETVKTVVADHPMVDLVPPENLRISPAADWRDPVNASPYCIEVIPMFVIDVLEKMSEINDKTGMPKWKPLSRTQILTGTSTDEHGVREARNGDGVDPKNDQFGEPDDFKTVWVHRNIIRRNGRDWLFYTLNTHHMLTDPVPLEIAYRHCVGGKRPYVLGFMVIEPHKTYPSSPTKLGRDLQAELNSTANQRQDNVRLAMNARHLVRQDDEIDFVALRASVPGGYIRVPDPEKSIKALDVKDVTASAYEEQDRMSVEFDALTGQMDQSSVQSNRALNETVGGMNLISSAANTVQELDLRTIVETFIEPVLRQVVMMIQAYEDDVEMIALAGSKAGVDALNDVIISEVFGSNLSLTVNVGMGSTDPVKRVEKFVLGLNSIAGLMPEITQMMKPEEVIAEIFGALGYQDGQLFFKKPEEIPPAQDPRQQQQAIEQQKAEQEMALNQQKAEQEMSIEQQKLMAEQERDAVRMNQEAEQFDLRQLMAQIQGEAAAASRDNEAEIP